jgi:hypothetical protein
MAESDSTSGPIILWVDYGYEGWRPQSFDTIKEALEAEKYMSKYIITRIVQYDVQEK